MRPIGIAVLALFVSIAVLVIVYSHRPTPPIPQDSIPAPSYLIECTPSAYWVSVGYGVIETYVWYNGDIIYHDDTDHYVLSTLDSMKKVSHRKAEAFVKQYKTSIH